MLIHKDNLINNIKQVKNENPNSKVCAMVKANAYGVGDEIVVKTLDSFVNFFGVACFFEAQKIRNLTNKPILIVGALERDCIDERFSYTCCDLSDVEYLISLNKQISVHIKVNTGMNRFGFKDLKEFKNALKIIQKSKLSFDGLFTHFATSDQKVEEQMKEFNRFIKVCHNLSFNPIIHADNSFVNEKFNHHLDMVRIGFSLYNRWDGWFLPAVEIKSEVVQIQNVKKGEMVGYAYRAIAKSNMKVAIIPFGYADGFDMNFLGVDLDVNGTKCKVLNICMDCFMLDVTNLNIKKGDEIYILNKFNSLNFFADYAETSTYEIMTKFSHSRVDRILI